MDAWVTGGKFMEQHGLPARILGDACYQGELTAYLPESLKQVYEASLIPRVPKYPPPGFDKLNYQQMGEFTPWNWAALTVLPVDHLRFDLNREYTPNPEYEINPQAEALAEVQCRKRVGRNVSRTTIMETARVIMMKEYDVIVDDKIIPYSQFKELFFYFNFEDFLRKRHISILQAEIKYRKRLANFRFKQKDIEIWIYKSKNKDNENKNIFVRKRIASKDNGTGLLQLRNTIKENEVAYNIIKSMAEDNVPILDIYNNIQGGDKVAACLLFDDSQSPEAAYRRLLYLRNQQPTSRAE